MPTTAHRTTLPATVEPATGATTIGAMILRATQEHHGTALRHPDEEGWHEISYRELGIVAREIAQGLIALGIAAGDSVAILSSTRMEWTLVDCGAHCAGAIVVPIYHTNSPEECHYVLHHSGARLVFCEDAEQLAKVEEVRARLPQLAHVVTFDGSGALSLDALRAGGADVDPVSVDRRVATVGPDDVATIVYTSGTTGPPKGCLTTHRNVMATIGMYEAELEFDPDNLVIFLFLPLAHSLARMTQLVTLDAGGTLAYWSGDARRVLEDITEVQPTHVPSVPRVFEKIHTKALVQAHDSGRLRATVFDRALGVGRRARARERAGEPLAGLHKLRYELMDRLVFSHVRSLFGDRLQLALSGAAPIAMDVLEFFDACGVLVMEGYGMTETTAAATLNTPRHFRLGTVGRPLTGTEVAVAADGEILMRGPHVFAGYHRNETATRETFTEDGWLRSGDLGEIDTEGYLRVTGRKKELIITSSGKNITPANIESGLRESRWISQAVVYGDNRPYIVAMLTLDPDEADALAEHCGVTAGVASLPQDPRVIAEIQKDVAAVNANLARIEQVKRFVILDHDLTQEGGELTPTMKIKRNVVYERYADIIDALYGSA